MNTCIISSDKNKHGVKMISRVLTGIASVALALVLSACGGGGGGGSPSAPTVAKSALIEAYGDSTTVGCTVTAGAPATDACPAAGYAIASTTAPAALQTTLQSSVGSTVTVSNRGVASISSNDLLFGTGRENGTTFDASMSISKAQIVTIDIGINDPGVVSDTSANITALVKIAQGHGKTVVLFTPNAVTTANAEAVATIRMQIIQIGKTLNVAVSDDFASVQASQWPALLSDGTHPTAQGYQTKGAFEANALLPIVRSML